MKVTIEGVLIQLTPEQIKQIEDHKRMLSNELKTFSSVLKHFGFKRIGIGCFQNEQRGWYAEINKSGNSYYAWMTGNGLKDSGAFPGGWAYHEVSELQAELISATS